MVDLNAALAASKDAIDQLILAGERTGPGWSAPRAPGKWSPSQIVEHVARALEESANVAAGRPSKFPKLPAVLHPIVRILLFKRVLNRAAFPKARTNRAMNPASGPATLSEGRARLVTAHQKFDDACRQLASRGERMRTTTFGTVGVEDYVRFMELHTRHHGRQLTLDARWKSAQQSIGKHRDSLRLGHRSSKHGNGRLEDQAERRFARRFARARGISLTSATLIQYRVQTLDCFHIKKAV